MMTGRAKLFHLLNDVIKIRSTYTIDYYYDIDRYSAYRLHNC